MVDLTLEFMLSSSNLLFTAFVGLDSLCIYYSHLHSALFPKKKKVPSSGYSPVLGNLVL